MIPVISRASDFEMATSRQYTIGLGEEGVGSKTTRLQPPGGHVHISSELVPESVMTKSANRVIRPPGGASTIFDEADAAAAASAANGERNVGTPERHVNYKMRSNFELGDEQPAPPPASAAQQQRRRSKPSVNPLTGDLVGVFTSERQSTTSASNGGSNEDLSSNCSVASMSTTSSINSSKESSPAPSTFSTPIKNRIPPGGYSTPLW